MTTREEVIAAAKEVDPSIDETTVDFDDEVGMKKLERFADIFFKSGAASRDAEIADLKACTAHEADCAEAYKAEADQLRTELVSALAACKANELTKQLAAEQAKNVGLLEIAKKGLRHYENRNIAHGTRNPAAIALDEIAATHSDTSALEAMIAKAVEKMREKCADACLRMIALRPDGGRLNESDDCYEAICALPAVTLEDLK